MHLSKDLETWTPRGNCAPIGAYRSTQAPNLAAFPAFFWQPPYGSRPATLHVSQTLMGIFTVTKGGIRSFRLLGNP